ncbi:cbb3-type cytochrome c oxidase subunit I [Rhodocytophaga aerolata]|uniref:Cbb3-type cytochrome c oxidase subunit I n=1 Tax=Rhodocytophaga aerolata TaxID=455078 RepID=A0ABT8RI60_9BACT|nr:cbb3-type cytochrome c oxidase subunit I [Rhodocytophaga aerolata]MDO1450853.1 cbb3-type cytochrome c oxidase subunit I [Rhodocytophaga aerolata]
MTKGKTLPAFISDHKLTLLVMASFFAITSEGFAQQATEQGSFSISEPGIMIMILLFLLPLLIGILILVFKLKNLFRSIEKSDVKQEARNFAAYLNELDEEQLALVQKRKENLEYRTKANELSGTLPPEDARGLVVASIEHVSPQFIAPKRKALPRPAIDPRLTKLILWFIGTATFWLVFGTTIGEYLGIKFVAPDVDQVSWLSFGRLRPIHTNSVFWGWSSLAMLGLAYYVVPMVSNTSINNIKHGWLSLLFINASVVMGTIFLAAGINNGGGEFREYIWPVMLLFAIGIVLTLRNFFLTVAHRKTKEIYVSNWYVIAATMFVIVISIIAYVPYWQIGLGESIIQGYYMHQGVGMWFMLFTLGLIYYFLPQQLNRPIYSYSLGILAFWAQILFYTVIGTHHFIFSSIPWSLQTTAIVGSVGMVIPVVAGTANFLLTFRGGWNKLRDSYTLPFFLVGIIFYFTGSLQGTVEAFRYTNLLWHFTDFTVAHSHITMYGIISFFMWAGIYAMVPRLTGKEPPQLLVGAHFWIALIGLMFYNIPLMIGGTLKGLSWMEGKPFIDSVVLMAPYWLWRAIGGSMMWFAHLIFAFNLYKMIAKKTSPDIKDLALEYMEGENHDKHAQPSPSTM